jgi:type I restriction enzyme, S subunit
MSELPPGWAWTTLGAIAEVVGGVTKDSKRQNQLGLVEVPYLRVANVQRGWLDLDNVAAIRVPPAKAEALRLQPGDVLFNEGGDRDKLGRGWVWDGQIPDCIHQNHVFRARLHSSDFLPKFLSYYGNSVGSRWFESAGRQTTNLASISLTALRKLPIPMPPAEEQRKIVEVLEDHLSRLDAADLLIGTVDRRFSPLVTSVLQETIPIETPAHWAAVTVGEAGHVDLGRQRHPDWHTGPEMRPYLRVANVFEDHIDTSDLKQMDFSGVFERYRLEPGDVLLNEGQSPEYLGRPAIYRGTPAEVAFTNTLLRFRARPDVMPEWALLVFRRHMRSGRFIRESRITTNIAHLSSKRLKSVEFPIPPILEQKQLVTQSSERFSAVGESKAVLQQTRLRSSGLRRALLAAAFSGRLTGRSSDIEVVEEMAGV